MVQLNLELGPETVLTKSKSEIIQFLVQMNIKIVQLNQKKLKCIYYFRVRFQTISVPNAATRTGQRASAAASSLNDTSNNTSLMTTLPGVQSGICPWGAYIFFFPGGGGSAPVGISQINRYKTYCYESLVSANLHCL